jgi:hypothetical protein
MNAALYAVALAELKRQHEAPVCGSPFVWCEDPEAGTVGVDGIVDLGALIDVIVAAAQLQTPPAA